MIKQIFQKSVLIIIGLFFALLFLETAMWTGGFVLSSWQTYQNNRVLKNKSLHTVLCIGESTTAGEYPVQLQQILNSKYPGKFSVIDVGLQATNLKIIIDLLNNNIQKYNPTIAICMMGINDNLFITSKDNYINNTQNDIFKNKIKIYKLYLILKEHIISLTQTQKIFADEISFNDTINRQTYKAVDLFLKGNHAQAAKLFNNILKIDPLNDLSYAYLVNIYYCSLTDYRHVAYEMAKKAVELGLKNRIFYYQIMIDYFISQNKAEQAKCLINTVFNDKNCMIDFDFYLAASKIMTQDQKEQILNKIFPDKSDIYYALKALNSIEQKDFDKAEQYFNMAEELRLNFPNEQTSQLYKLIVKKLIDSNIKLICMQYPVRSIKPLQNILKDTHYYNKITFLSNEEIFKKALKEKPYNEIFTDQFAGDFGHCTDYGNTLIAENIAKTLTDLTKND